MKTTVLFTFLLCIWVQFSMSQELVNFQFDTNIPTITSPIKISNRAITIDVNINGTKRPFILDNLSTKTILNSQYYTITDSVKAEKIVTIFQIFNETNTYQNICNIYSFDFYGCNFANKSMLSSDLSLIEERTKRKIYGILGNDFLKQFDLLFNFANNTITFLKPSESAKYMVDNFDSEMLKEIPISINGHIPVITGIAKDKSLNLGFLFSNGVTTFEEKKYELFKKKMDKETKSDFINIDLKTESLHRGYIKNILFSTVDFKYIDTVFNNIDYINKNYKSTIDGMIGFDILSKQPTLVSITNQKVTFVKSKIN